MSVSFIVSYSLSDDLAKSRFGAASLAVENQGGENLEKRSVLSSM
jgi:hypothetical protein